MACRSSLALILALLATGTFPGCRFPFQKSKQPPASALGSTEKANAELLNEMYRVVLMREPSSAEDKMEFAGWLDVIGQGASFEGVYRGFTLSTGYHQLEQEAPVVTQEVRQVFVEAMVPLLLETGIFFKSEREISKWGEQFAGASIFTLKREMGEQVLAVLEPLRKYPVRRAEWFGRWAAAMSARGLDFGLPLRNKKDEHFHRQWAMRASEDLLTWEALNRVHRFLNHVNKTGGKK